MSDNARKATRFQEISSGLHGFYAGKMETVPRCQVKSMEDFSVWYSPGVAQPCLDIVKDPELAYEYTSKGNTVAVISDGTRVLGLGDIGPLAGLPVMEGKALLYKYLGGVDSVALMLDAKDPDRFIDMVMALQPSFGGVNLEDIAQPKCFRILDTLRKQADIPVWHDDQQGTATVTLAGLLSACRVTGKKVEDLKIAFIGTGAANVACMRLIFARGVNPANCVAVDVNGTLGKFRKDIYDNPVELAEALKLCETTNREGIRGGIPEAMKGADVVISYSRPGPGVILPDWVRGMAKDPVVFSCANPTPEIWPWEALEAGAAVVATGRSDLPNQVNNSLCFPGIFRGTLDVRARTISDSMCFAAADALVEAVGNRLAPDRLLPTMEEWEVVPRIAARVGMQAQAEGLARIARSAPELEAMAREKILRSRGITEMMMARGFIPPSPEA